MFQRHHQCLLQDLEGLKDENGLYAGKFKTVEDLVKATKNSKVSLVL